MPTLDLLLIATGAALFAALVYAAIVSWRESELRAVGRLLGLAVLAPLPFMVVVAMPSQAGAYTGAGLLGVTLLTAFALLVPTRSRHRAERDTPTTRVDERDIMFARGRLRPDSPEFDAYYRMRPENLASDNHTRSLPGLLSLDAEKAEPLAFAAAEAGFSITEALRDRVDGEVASERTGDRSAEEWTEVLEELARAWGDADVGVTEIEPAHIYTHIGR